MSIQVLSLEVVNQIAAGEVVERPAHLVKELIENSIDANATIVHLEIAHGGRSVRISDDGDGILSTDLSKSLQRHATSKISASDDLWKLQSYGFRGEALASIGAVSKLSIESCHHEERIASQIHCEYGQVSVVKPASRTRGTEIKLDGLFENVPARLKFLKSDSSEIQQIKQIVKAIALAHPGIEFKMVQDGELQIYFKKEISYLARAQSVLEKNELFAGTSQSGKFTAEVIFSSPHEVTKTAKQIWIFAQGRFIQDRALYAAVMDSYRSLLMHGEYPYAVVHLKCETSEIDVNIHPTKSQVKFQDASSAFRSVHGALRQSLEKAPWLKKMDASGAPAPQSTSLFTSTTTSSSSSHQLPGAINYEMLTPAQPESLKFFDSTFSRTQFKQKEFNSEKLSALRIPVAGYWSSLQVLGQANLTYIICQKEDRLVYVDQHAAHERVVYETLMKAWKHKNFEIQDFLFPFVIDLTESQVDALLAVESQILELGIQIERLGPVSLGIKAAPSLIKEAALPRLFEKMAEDLQKNGGSFAIEKKVSDLFATMACHSVVRAGQSLSGPQMQELLKSMDQFSLSSFCPHGRPVSVETSFMELEKLFGRIN